MTAPDPWEPFDKLREAITKTMNELGIDLITWVIMPGHDPASGDRACQIAFEVRPDAFLTDEQRDTRKEFDAMMEDDREHDRLERLAEETEKTKEKLLDLTKGGIFADEDDEEETE